MANGAVRRTSRRNSGMAGSRGLTSASQRSSPSPTRADTASTAAPAKNVVSSARPLVRPARMTASQTRFSTMECAALIVIR